MWITTSSILTGWRRCFSVGEMLTAALAAYGLDPEHIVQAAKTALSKKN